MATRVFNSIPGTVVAFEMDRVIPGTIAISDPLFPSEIPTSVMISSMAWAQATNQQFQSSLDGAVYIYVFGDRMGTVQITGFTFVTLCDADEDGLTLVSDFYNSNRAAARSTPIQITIGSDTISGFLTGMNVTAMGSGEEGSGMALMNRFELMVNALPKE